MQHTDVIVAGGGIAGLTAAYAFAQAGFDVVCVDPTPLITDRSEAGADLRSTAFLQPSQAFLQEIGLWDKVSDHSSPLDVMRIIDAGGVESPPIIRLQKDFVASDVSDLPFGWNVPNYILRREFQTAASAHPNITLKSGARATKLFTRMTEARVTFDDGDVYKCKLVIAADGRHSTMRQIAGIDVSTTRYGQTALAFAVTHDIPHQNISTEIHRKGGPFTLVPLPDYQGHPSSAIVWMEKNSEADRLRGLETAGFETEMNQRSCGVLGDLKLITQLSAWPMMSQIAERLNGQRVALIAEAAHVVPPIGAQGLNMSLGDIRTLVELGSDARDEIGSERMLEAYNKARLPDIRTRVTGISLLNQASMAENQTLRNLRAVGLETLYSLPPVRKTLMKMGLGSR